MICLLLLLMIIWRIDNKQFSSYVQCENCRRREIPILFSTMLRKFSQPARRLFTKKYRKNKPRTRRERQCHERIKRLNVLFYCIDISLKFFYTRIAFWISNEQENNHIRCTCLSISFENGFIEFVDFRSTKFFEIQRMNDSQNGTYEVLLDFFRGSSLCSGSCRM